MLTSKAQNTHMMFNRSKHRGHVNRYLHCHCCRKQKITFGIRLVGLGVWFSLRVREVENWSRMSPFADPWTSSDRQILGHWSEHQLSPLGHRTRWLNGFDDGLQIYFDMHLLVQSSTTFIILDNLQNVGAFLTSTNNDNDSNVIHLKWHPAPKTNEVLMSFAHHYTTNAMCSSLATWRHRLISWPSFLWKVIILSPNRSLVWVYDYGLGCERSLVKKSIIWITTGYLQISPVTLVGNVGQNREHCDKWGHISL